MRKVLGIDVGGTNIRGAVINERTEILSRRQIKSDAKEGIDKVVENLIGFIKLFDELKPSAIGIGFPGIINHEEGILIQSPNIPGGADFPLLNTLKRHFESLPLLIENDVNCIALAEFWEGSGKGCNSIIMLAVGTGLGGGIILKKELWRGEDGTAGEIGHMVIDHKGPKCNCGSSGCLESFVSAEAVRRVVKSSPVLTEKTRGTEADDIPRKIMELAAEGDTEAVDLWKQFGSYLGIGIVNLINLFNIKDIIVGGGLSNAWDFFIDSAEHEIKKRALKTAKNKLNIRRAKLEDDAGIVGSALLTLKNPELLNKS